MDETTRTHLANINSSNKDLQNAAYEYLQAATGQRVEWAYEVWDEMVENLRHPDNRCRAIAAQVLCNLSASDPDKRILQDFESLLAVTRDERFVTARHCLQNLWKIGRAGPAQQQRLVEGLARRFQECAEEKNPTLIRYDIIEDFKKLHDVASDPALRARALELIETEADLKYRHKYAALWRTSSRADGGRKS